MNNVACEIIQDLLPLYCDGVCSEESRELVHTHLQNCGRCREELRLMKLPVEAENVEVSAAEAASRIWKRNKRKAFHMGVGVALAVVLTLAVLGAGLFLGRHYRGSCGDGDFDAMRDAVSEMNQNAGLSPVEASTRKGGYLAVSCRDEKGLWYVGIFTPDSVFPDRWVAVGGLSGVRPGKLASWNWKKDDGDTVLVCFGAELPEAVSGYTFVNGGITYICPVKERSVLDFFFVPDAYDAGTYLEAIRKPNTVS